MKKLDLKIKKNGFLYTQIKRTEKKAMYQSDSGFYEVFYIDTQQASESMMGGVKVVREHKELFPSDEKFGKSAWCYSTGRNKKTAFDLANERYELM